MIPNVKRGVSAVRARNSTLPRRWPWPGGMTMASSGTRGIVSHRRVIDQLLAQPLERLVVVALQRPEHPRGDEALGAGRRVDRVAERDVGPRLAVGRELIGAGRRPAA